MKRLPKQLEREVYIPTDKGVGKLGLQSREGSDWACLHNLLECSNVQDQSLLIRTPQIWWWVSLHISYGISLSLTGLLHLV